MCSNRIGGGSASYGRYGGYDGEDDHHEDDITYICRSFRLPPRLPVLPGFSQAEEKECCLSSGEAWGIITPKI